VGPPGSSDVKDVPNPRRPKSFDQKEEEAWFIKAKRKPLEKYFRLHWRASAPLA
jgi:hypothetical protein